MFFLIKICAFLYRDLGLWQLTKNHWDEKHCRVQESADAVPQPEVQRWTGRDFQLTQGRLGRGRQLMMHLSSIENQVWYHAFMTKIDEWRRSLISYDLLHTEKRRKYNFMSQEPDHHRQLTCTIIVYFWFLALYYKIVFYISLFFLVFVKKRAYWTDWFENLPRNTLKS